VRLVIGRNEALSRASVGDGIAGVNQLRALRPEDVEKFADVIAAVCRYQRIDRRRGRGEGFLGRGSGQRRDCGKRDEAHRCSAKPQRDQNPVCRMSQHRSI
jgi:hypothetical protein